MKKQAATIKAALNNIEAKDGCHSVVLRVQWQNKRADYTLPIHIKPYEWSKTSEQVKSNNPNYKNYNDTITYYKGMANNILKHFITENKIYTAKQIIDVLKQNDNTQKKSSTITNVMGLYFEENPITLKENTKNVYKQAVNNFIQFAKKDIDVCEVDKPTIKKYLEWLDNNDKLGNATKRSYSTRIRALFAFSKDKSFITDIPFSYMDKGSIKERFRRLDRPKALNPIQYDLLLKFRATYMAKDTEWRKNLMKPFSKDFILNFFVCGCNLQGLAPIDMLKLGPNHIVKNDSETIVWDLERTKTRRNVRITLYKETNKDMFDAYLDRLSEDKLLFPLFDRIDLKDNKAVTERMKNFNSCACMNLPKVWNDFNEWLYDKVKFGGVIEASYVDKGENKTVPINIDNYKDYQIKKEQGITLYSYRHTYATFTYIAEQDLYKLSKDLGRGISGIECYIDTLPYVMEIRDKERYYHLNGITDN